MCNTREETLAISSPDKRTDALENIVKMRRDFIQDLQKRVAILEDKLLEKTAKNWL
jgi:hypothetical protein